MKEADDLIEKRRKKSKQKIADPQVALVALDAETGEIRALVGGHNYGLSQFDRAWPDASPAPSSSPSSTRPHSTPRFSRSMAAVIITPETSVIDEPTVFTHDARNTEPGQLRRQVYGQERCAPRWQRV